MRRMGRSGVVVFGLLPVLWATPASAQTCTEPALGVVSYIGRIEPRRVLFAWGRTDGEQTIGYGAPATGKAEIWIDGVLRTTEASRGWAWVDGLEEDREHRYAICLEGRRVRQAVVRTYPVAATRLTFFVIGDYGTGGRPQLAVASAMARALRERQAAATSPVRFVLTTGDNLYRSGFASWLRNSHSGASDRDWQNKFFAPYNEVLASVPFLPSVGNHDRGETEREADLSQYYDNFLFAPDQRMPFYTFNYGGLAQFFSLNTASRSTSEADKDLEFGPNSRQRAWLASELAASRTRWTIPFFHHPSFTAGPDHADAESRGRAQHFLPLFASRAAVAFSGHEHNFQYSEASRLTGGVRYVVSGAGGNFDPVPGLGALARAGIEGWANGHHFLQVEIDNDTMMITVIGVDGPVVPRDRTGQERPVPAIPAR